MNQCVPNWDVEENHHPHPAHRLILRAHSNSSSLAPDVPSLDYEVAELTWENGQLAMHGLGPPRLGNGKTSAAAGPVKYTWGKQLPAGGTLESVVNQATTILPSCKTNVKQSGCRDAGEDELVPWFEDHRRQPATAALGLAMDALVPCSNKYRNNREPSSHVPSLGKCVVGCSATHVGSCSAATAGDQRLPRVSTATAGDQSVSGSATYGRDSRQVTVETCDREVVTPGFTSPSLGSPENTSSAKQCTKTGDEHDSACQSRNERDVEEEKKKGNGKSSISTKRSRAAAIHNQSERKRRDKINQRMKTLQKLVPNSNKTDKASMLDEVIEYLKQLQAQVNIMSRMNMPSMMLPLALQQQLQMMSMMAPMGLGMNMGMGMGMGVMDLNSIGRPNMAAGMPHVLHPTTFIPATSWDGLGVGDRLQAAAPSSSAMPDPFVAFLACQSQPMTMDAYARMGALYQQFQQPPGPASQNKFI